MYLTRRDLLQKCGLIMGIHFLPGQRLLAVSTASPQLWVSKSPDRSSAILLSGSKVAGTVWIFVIGSDIRKVIFYINDIQHSHKPYHVEHNSSWDLNGTGEDGYDVNQLGNGIHNITARVQGRSGVMVISSTFIVESWIDEGAYSNDLYTDSYVSQ